MTRSLPTSTLYYLIITISTYYTVSTPYNVYFNFIYIFILICRDVTDVYFNAIVCSIHVEGYSTLMLGIGVGDAQSRSKNVQLMLESNMMEACCYLHNSTGLHFNTTLFPITKYMSTIQKSRKCHELPRKSIKN